MILFAAVTVALVGISQGAASAVTKAQLQAKAAKLQVALNALSNRISDVESELELAQEAVERHSKALATAASRVEILKTAHWRRTAELYIEASQDMLTTLTSSDTVDVFAERLGYLDQLRSSEEGSLEELIALRRHARVESQELGLARDDAKVAFQALVTQRRDLDAKLHEYGALIALAGLGRVKGRASRTRIPGFECPVRGPHGLSNNFGAPRRGGPHQGDDLPADSGTPAVAVLPGHIVDVVHGGWMGRGVIMRDSAGNEWWYAHLSASYVSQGESVAGGELLGRVGCSGNCSGPHLHFEYHPNGGSARNPYKILRAAC